MASSDSKAIESSSEGEEENSSDEIALENMVVERFILRNKEFLQENALKRKTTCNDSDFVGGKRACITSSVDSKVNRRRSPRTNQTNEVSKGVIPQSLSPDSDDLPIKYSVERRRSLRTNKKEELKRGRKKRVQTVISTTSNNFVNRKSTRCSVPPVESRDLKVQKNKRQKPDNHKIMGTSDTNTFRSNLLSMLQMVQGMKQGEFSTDVDTLMKSTPFGQLFQVFTEGNLAKKDVRNPQNGILRIMSCFDKEKKVFIFGGKEVAFKADDVALVFGLPMKGREVDLHLGTSKDKTTDTLFFKRNFKSNKYSYVTKPEVKMAMKLCVYRTDDHRVEDMCKLLIMYMFMTFLNTGVSYRLRISALYHLDDFRRMGSIAWAKVMYKLLLKEIEKWEPDKPYNLFTCPVVLLYFLLEHTNLASPRQCYNINIPRVAKWSLNGLIIPPDLKTNKRIQVTAVLKYVDNRELGLLDEGETLIQEHNTSESIEDQLRNALMDNDRLRKRNNLLEENNKKLQEEYNNFQYQVTHAIKASRTLATEDEEASRSMKM